MTERRSVAILFTGILIIAAASLGPSLMGEPMAELDASIDETLDEYADAPAREGPSATADPAFALRRTAHRATVVLEDMLVDPDTAIPSPLLSNARALVVIPASHDTASAGKPPVPRGILAGRSAAGEWSSPVHVLLSGREARVPSGSDLVLVFTRDGDLASLVEGPLPLGEGTPVAPGPLGRGATIGSMDELDAVYAWTRSRDRVIGTALERAHLAIDDGANAIVYGEGFDAGAALDGEMTTPSASGSFREMLLRHAPRIGS